MTLARIASAAAAGVATLWLFSAVIRLPPQESLPLAVLAGLAVACRPQIEAFLRARRRRRAATQAPRDPMLAVLSEADGMARRMRQAGGRILHAEMKARIERIAAAAETVLSHARRGALEPRLGARILSYYLPRAAELASAFPALEARSDAGRQDSVIELMGRLEAVFVHAAEGATAPGLKELDVDMELLAQALDEDLPRAQ